MNHSWLWTLFVVACARPEAAGSTTSGAAAPRSAATPRATTEEPFVASKPQAGAMNEAASSRGDAAFATASATPSPGAPTDETSNTRRRSAHSSPNEPCQFLAIGDSLTDPKSGGGGYLDAARTQCGCAVTNLGKGGDMVNQMRTRLFAHLAEAHSQYDFVVVFGGVNDLYSDLTAKRTVEKIQADLARMYRAVRSPGTRVIAVTVAPWGGFRRYFTDQRWANTLALNAWIRSTPALGLTDAVVDAEASLTCDSSPRLCAEYAAPFRDGLHFGPKGHRRLALDLAETLRRMGCKSTSVSGSADL